MKSFIKSAFHTFALICITTTVSPFPDVWVTAPQAESSNTVPNHWTVFDTPSPNITLEFYADIINGMGFFLRYRQAGTGRIKDLYFELRPSSGGINKIASFVVFGAGRKSGGQARGFNRGVHCTGRRYYRLTFNTRSVAVEIGDIIDGSFQVQAQTSGFVFSRHSGGEVAEWLEYDFTSTHGYAPNQPQVADLQTVPSSNHPIFPAPASTELSTFRANADAFEATITSMDLATAQAVTEPSLQTDLGYASLDVSEATIADTRIAELLGLVQDRIDALQFAAFNTASAALLADLPNQTQATLGAYTTASLRTSLGYDNLADDDTASADSTIANILARATELAALSPYFTDAGGSVYEAISSDDRTYSYDATALYDYDSMLLNATAGPLQRATLTAATYHAWYQDSTSGTPVSTTPGGWYAEGTYDNDDSSNSMVFAYFYDPVAKTGADPFFLDGGPSAKQIAIRQWDYDPATLTWSNSETGHSWSYNSSTKVWTHTATESDGVSTSTFEWTFNHKDQNWTNTTTGDVWSQPDSHFWEKIGGSETPAGGFTEKWAIHGEHARYYSNFSGSSAVNSRNAVDIISAATAGEGRAPFSMGVWGEYDEIDVIDDTTPAITWTWSTSMDSRGAWTRDNGGTISVYTYNDTEQRWEDTGTPGYPPPFLPPFVVTTHSEIMTAYNSLVIQNIVS